MSPLDDELRTALHRRAGALAPSPDPLAGVERRAGRMRRRRTAASIVGSALAVAAVALAVPVLSPSPDEPAPRVARSTAPTAEPTPGTTAVVTAPPYALDLDDPWPYRGAPLEQLGGQGTVDDVARQVAARHGVGVTQVRLRPLYGQRYEPSAAVELVWVAAVAGEDRWGVAVSSESGPELRVDELLPSPARALAAALPGDEVARLLVVAAPAVGSLQYGADRATEWADMTALADGVAIAPLEGDPATDAYRVLDPSGTELFSADAPDVVEQAPVEGGGQPASPAPEPQNLLDWPARGSATPELRSRVLDVYAQAVGTTPDDVDGRLLFGGSDDTGREFAFLQAWRLGQDAQTVGLVTGGGQPDVPFLGPVLDRGPAVLAFVVPAGTGQDTDTLVVLPEPAAGQVLYAPDATSEPAPVTPAGDGAWLVERSTRPGDDQLLVLDGDGDLDAPVFRGSVLPLLCGAKGCG